MLKQSIAGEMDGNAYENGWDINQNNALQNGIIARRLNIRRAPRLRVAVDDSRLAHRRQCAVRRSRADRTPRRIRQPLTRRLTGSP